jgi:phosphotransferase system HPr-like phosphotransfer protein
MKIQATVTISAPGGLANSPAEVIEKALRDAGCKVTITNDNADLTGNKATSLEVWHVNLVVNHQPWGG